MVNVKFTDLQMPHPAGNLSYLIRLEPPTKPGKAVVGHNIDRCFI